MPNEGIEKIVERLTREGKTPESGWFFSEEGRMIQAFWENVPYYATRINDRITLYKAHQENESRPKDRVIGVQVKGIKSLEEIQDFRPMY
jgi:hypothetical protein